MSRQFATTTVDVVAPVPNPEDYSFISNSGNITVTGVLWTFADGVLRTGTGFTDTLAANEAQDIKDLAGLTEYPTGFVGATLNFSGAFRWSCEGSETGIEANPTRYPLVDTNLNSRTYGRIG